MRPFLRSSTNIVSAVNKRTTDESKERELKSGAMASFGQNFDFGGYDHHLKNFLESP